MRLVLSLSGPLAQNYRSDLTSPLVVESEDCRAPALMTHSMQVSWQMHSFTFGDRWILVAVEAYSRYTLFISYFSEPAWEQLLGDFREVYQQELFRCLGAGGFVKPHQRAVVARHFRKTAVPLCICVNDTQLEEHLTKAKRWLGNYFEKPHSPLVEGALIEGLTLQVNKLNHGVKNCPSAEKICPIERFLKDSLYRFADGLCELDIHGCKVGGFPNPHRKPIDLHLVPSQSQMRAPLD